MPEQFKLISTGLLWEPLEDENSKNFIWNMEIRPRSGMAAKFGVSVLNSPGTIDASYKDEIKVILINHSKNVYEIKKGDRIAQAIFNFRPKVEIIEGKINKDNNRGGGFGSSGR